MSDKTTSGTFFDYNKDRIENASTGLMAIKDIATCMDIPINIHFDKHWIHVIVGFGTPYQKKRSFYTQDCYRHMNATDYIYESIKSMINELLKEINNAEN